MAKAQNRQFGQSIQNSKIIENDLNKRGELKNGDSRYSSNSSNSSFFGVGKGV